jgi:type 1 glutamine amidotransferase
MRLDAGHLDLSNPKVHRTDGDFAVTWAKMYGRGRVYYSTLGHPKENWDNPNLQKMYTEAIEWAPTAICSAPPGKNLTVPRTTQKPTMAS